MADQLFGSITQDRHGTRADPHEGAPAVDDQDDKGRLVAVLSGMRMWQNPRGFHMQLMVAYPLEFTAEQWREIQ